MTNAFQKGAELHRHSEKHSTPVVKVVPANSKSGTPAITAAPLIPHVGKQGQAVTITPRHKSSDSKSKTTFKPPAITSVIANKVAIPGQHDDHKHDQPGRNLNRTPDVRKLLSGHDHNVASGHRHGNDDHDHDAHHDHRYGGFGSRGRNTWWSIFLGSPGYRFGGPAYGPRFCGNGFGGGYGGGYCPTGIGTGLAIGCAPLLLQQDFAVAPVATPVVTTSAAPASISEVTAGSILSAEDFNALKFVDQRKVLVDSAARLRDELKLSANGDAWILHLRLNDIAPIVGTGDEPPAADVRQQLRVIADLFDDVARDPALRDVAQPTSFRTLHIGLREFSTEPIVHLRRLLTASAEELMAKLGSWDTGDRWRAYLRIDSLLSLDDSLVNAQPRLMELDALQAKFERIQSDAAFETVTKEEAFQHTRLALQWYLTELRRILSELPVNNGPQEPERTLLPPVPMPN